MIAKDEAQSGGVECKKYKKYLDAEATEVPSPAKSEAKAEGDSTFEALLSLVGYNGLWNVGFLILVHISAVPAAFMVLSYQFLGATPDYWCHIQELHDANWTTQQIIDFAIPRTLDGKLEGCLQRDYNYSLAASLGYEVAKDNLDLITNEVNGTTSCLRRDFNHTEYKSTLVTDFDLVCERRALYSTTSSIVQVGMLFASLSVGYVTDLFGKRRLILVSYVLLMVFGVLMAMAPNIELYLISKFFESVFRMSASITEYILILEICSNTQRSYISSLGIIPWAVGQMILPAIAYYMREWRYLLTIFVAPYVYTVSYYWFLPESPRWLILRGRYAEVVEFLKKIAYWNKRNLPCDEKLLEMVKSINIKEIEQQGEQEGVAKQSLIKRGLDQLKELFQTKTKIFRTVIMFFCWFTTAFVYYGISLISTNIGSSEYWYMFFGGVVEVCSSFVLLPLIQYGGRRRTLIGCYLMCAASILGSLGVGESVAWKMTLSLSGKFAILATFALVYLLAAEINTTKSRTLAVGISSVVARFGSISSPYVNDLIGETNPKAPIIMFGVLPLISALLAFGMPETRKAVLPESATDIEKIGSKVKRNKHGSSEKPEGCSPPSS